MRDFTRWNDYFARDTSTYREEASAAFFEFQALSDYIFKSPRLLEAEKKLEKEKLDAYHPADDPSEQNQRLRLTRAVIEFGNLNTRFPVFQRTSNLLIATSLFEHHMVKLARRDSARRNRPLRADPGVVEVLAYVEKWGSGFPEAETLGPAKAIVKLRNRLVHSGGFLTNSPKCKEVREIIRTKSYASRWHREHWGANFPDLHPAFVSPHKDGEVIRLDENFAFLSCSYFSDLHFEACAALDPV